MDNLGRTLTKAVAAYNQTVGTLESRVLVSARRLSQLGVVDSELLSPAPVDGAARALSAPELAGSPPGLSEFSPELPDRGDPITSPAPKPGTESPEISGHDRLIEASQWT